MAGSTRVSSHTRLFCLLGDPVSRSKSPAMMNAAFAAAGIDGVYLALPVGGPALGAVLGALKEVGCGGANVTAPHKQAVIPFLDRLSGTAEKSGSVNTIVFDGGSAHRHTAPTATGWSPPSNNGSGSPSGIKRSSFSARAGRPGGCCRRFWPEAPAISSLPTARSQRPSNWPGSCATGGRPPPRLRPQTSAA